ncbi:hypothetical protein DM02DRAFT_655312 [Periconia macrospinosa]|uniref:Uncharacterized protein n=1 Tax=Periconia macrospinosa TaxID=97972 RepID=A0A2V1DQX1_9PLEO|nr:hypothetical protein DM02DRAFT_655312 [Periconia macrospinosa]
MSSAYTVSGAVSGFGPLTGRYAQSADQSLAAYALLMTGCLPVIAGFFMIWKSQWGNRLATPAAGYTLIGFFGPVVALT